MPPKNDWFASASLCRLSLLPPLPPKRLNILTKDRGALATVADVCFVVLHASCPTCGAG